MRAFENCVLDRTETLRLLEKDIFQDSLEQIAKTHGPCHPNYANTPVEEATFGIPMGVGVLIDGYHDMDGWYRRALMAIPQGADLSGVPAGLATWLFGSDDSPLAPWQGQKYAHAVVALCERVIAGDMLGVIEARERVAELVDEARESIDPDDRDASANRYAADAAHEIIEPYGVRSALYWATVAAGERAYRHPEDGMSSVDSAIMTTKRSRELTANALVGLLAGPPAVQQVA